MEYHFINPKKITDILFDDDQYVIEFCEAGVTSLDEFINSFQEHLIDRNMDDLRKAGHKIKPGVQMMGADEVVEEYEHAKQLLENDAEEEKLGESVKKMTTICSTIKNELNELAQNLN